MVHSSSSSKLEYPKTPLSPCKCKCKRSFFSPSEEFRPNKHLRVNTLQAYSYNFQSLISFQSQRGRGSPESLFPPSPSRILEMLGTPPSTCKTPTKTQSIVRRSPRVTDLKKKKNSAISRFLFRFDTGNNHAVGGARIHVVRVHILVEL